MPKWTTTNPAPEQLFSIDALNRAWRFVRRSGDSPGSDRVKRTAFEEMLPTELRTLQQDVVMGTYRPHHVLRFHIKKSNGKTRPISVWSLRDRVAQRVVLEFITPILEKKFLPCSYGFRPGISIEQAVEAVEHFRASGRPWVLDADIQDCFGSIDPELLMFQVRRVLHSTVAKSLIEQWLKTPVQGSRGELAGVSQGGVISPILANLYLHRFDEMVFAALPQSKLIRFADDFVILNRSETEASWSLDVARRSLENLRLALNMRKTRIVHFDEGFQFLGYAFTGSEYRKL